MTAEPIVFIPGFMCDARAFLPQMVQLGASHACQVILPSGEETVERLSEVVLANAPAKFVAVGHGLGGDVVMDVLRRAPERVLRVVLISTDPLAEPPKAAAVVGQAVVELSNTKELGKLLYSQYLYPLEVAAVILLVAIIAAIALTLRERKDSKHIDPADQIRVKRADRVRLVKMNPTMAAPPPQEAPVEEKKA